MRRIVECAVLCGILLPWGAELRAQQEDDCVIRESPTFTFRVCCIGANCGTQFEFHCHGQDAKGVECWDIDGIDVSFPHECINQPANQPGQFSNPCGPKNEGQRRSAALTVGGYNIFISQIRKQARPRIVREAEAERAEPVVGTGSASSATGLRTGGLLAPRPGDRYRLFGAPVHFQATGAAGPAAGTGVIVADAVAPLEAQSWEFRRAAPTAAGSPGTNEGDTVGLRFFWNRETERGRLVGVSASYQEADPDFGETTRLVNGNLSFGKSFGGIWSFSVSGTVNDISGDPVIDDTLLGGSGKLSFSKYTDNGVVFSGGVIAQFLTADESTHDDSQTVGYGLAFGFPILRRFTLDLEAFGVSIVDGDFLKQQLAGESSFWVAGASVGVFFTPRFALSLGYRVTEGIEGFDSDTYTLGVSRRWE